MRMQNKFVKSRWWSSCQVWPPSTHSSRSACVGARNLHVRSVVWTSSSVFVLDGADEARTSSACRRCTVPIRMQMF